MIWAMKTLVTHINPHLDDISAIWLYKKFHPEFKDAQIEFINASRDEALKFESEDKIYFGTGGGKFDEHKGDLEDCAASLVWKDIKAKGIAPKDEAELSAYEELVQWNRLIDLGKGSPKDVTPFSVPAFIRTKDSTQGSSLKSQNLGEEILDRILEILKKRYQSEKDWETKVEFESRFGKSYAISSETIDREFCKEKGGNLFLMYDPSHSSAQYFTPSFEIDLEPIYEKAKQLEPEAAWFLHQSHHMVICGSSSAPNVHTELSFEKLIEIAKES